MKKCVLFLLLPAFSISRADVKLNPLFGDGAVLQRERSVPIWGEASPGESVRVEFGGRSASAVADDKGRWLARLEPMAASSESRDLVVRGANTITLHDVVVGDVWLASGQSNMASPLSSGSAAQAVPAANDKLLRFFTVTKAVAAEPLGAVKGRWDVSSPTVAGNFSAVAYFFAQEIRGTQNVPVGIINSSWGGTPIKTWMTLASLQEPPPLSKFVAEWDAALAKHNAAQGDPQLMEAYYKDMKEWEDKVDAPFRAARKGYDAAVAAAKASGQPMPTPPKPDRPEPDMPDPIAMPSASKRPSVPTITANAMIIPLAPFAVKGVLWYQGEADISRAADYRDLLPRLISGWRTVWAQDVLPFLIVQLPGNGKDPTPVASQGIPFLREAQALALNIPGTGVTVTADIGDEAEVHPDNKIHVGRRLALLAREKVYHENVVGTGPVFKSFTVSNGTVRVEFDGVGTGLVIGEAPWRAKNAAVLPTDRLVGFYVAGADQQWVEAEARIDGDAVIVSSASVPEPVAVRYGWANTPEINLSNREGLPAMPFRTDDWAK